MKIRIQVTIDSQHTYRMITLVDGQMRGTALLPKHEIVKARNTLAERWSEDPRVTEVIADEIPEMPWMRSRPAPTTEPILGRF